MSTQETNKDVRPESNVVKSDSAKTVALTAYQGGPAVIREVRQIVLPVGKSRVFIGGLPSQFVHNSQTITGVTGEGKFKTGPRSLRPANLTLQAMLLQSVGKKIVLIETTTDGKERPVEGVLQHIVDGRYAVLKTDDTANGGVLVVPITPKFRLSEGVPAGLSNLTVMAMQPDVEKAGDFGIKLLYESEGLSWAPWYEIFYNVKTGKLERFACYVDVTNNSGANFEDANLKLISGVNVSGAANRGAKRARSFGAQPAMAMAMTESAGGGGFESADVDYGGAEVENVGEAKMYKIAEPVTLENGVPNTYTLVHAADVPVEHEYHVYAGYFHHLDDDNAADLPKLPVNVKLRLKNDKANNIGSALPPGDVRILEPDSSGDLQKTDSSRVSAHISDGEEFTLDLRNPARDLKVTRELIDSKQDPEETDDEVVVTPEGGLPTADDTDHEVLATEGGMEGGPRMTMMPTMAMSPAVQTADVEPTADDKKKKIKKPRFAEEEREVTVLNYKDKEVVVTVHEQVPADAEFLSKTHEFAKFTASTGRGTFKVTVPAKGKDTACGSFKIRYRIKWRLN